MSKKSADDPFEAVAAFKEHVRQHCEQNMAGNVGASPMIKAFDHNPSFNENRRCSDGQLPSMVGSKNLDGFGGSRSTTQKTHHLKAVTSEVRRSSDGLLQPPAFANHVPFAGPTVPGLMLPKHIQQQEASRNTEVQVSETEFRVDLDVSAYAPEELEVRIVGDDVVIQGRHAEGGPGENANITRQFTRRYTLPEDVLVDGVSVFLAKTGQMSVTAPRKGVREEKSAVEKKVKFQE